jgi:hypothetical protein
MDENYIFGLGNGWGKLGYGFIGGNAYGINCP